MNLLIFPRIILIFTNQFSVLTRLPFYADCFRRIIATQLSKKETDLAMSVHSPRLSKAGMPSRSEAGAVFQSREASFQIFAKRTDS